MNLTADSLTGNKNREKTTSVTDIRNSCCFIPSHGIKICRGGEMGSWQGLHVVLPICDCSSKMSPFIVDEMLALLVGKPH